MSTKLETEQMVQNACDRIYLCGEEEIRSGMHYL
jgi:hypothetical protein